MKRPPDQGRPSNNFDAADVPNIVQGSEQGQFVDRSWGGLKSSSLVAVLATRSSSRCERGWEAGELERGARHRAPRSSDSSFAGALGGADMQRRLARVRDLAESLRSELERRPEIARLECQVRVAEALVRDAALDGENAPEHSLLSAQAFVGPDPDRPRWTRLTLPAASGGAGGAWPEGFVPALERLARSGLQPPILAADALAGCTEIVLDAFAFSDLLRLAARRWSAGEPGQEAGIAAGARVDERDLLTGSTPSPVVRDGRLVATPSSLGISARASWREAPRPSWRGLSTTLPGEQGPVLRPGTLLLAALQVLPGALLAGGLFTDAEGAEHALQPLSLPDPGVLLASLVAARGPGVVDASGLPVCAPPVLLERERVLSALR